MMKLEYTVNTKGTDVLDFSTGSLWETTWGEYAPVFFSKKT